ncbi:DUF4376 domain-containing protein [Thalassobaculum litoreum]|uniref:DUF4376 domain-containing protein n=1 Tax=Thalassobaculum litoreum DSM 18839 TaxID=1123362 RepID=A0A8G2BK49_9PROT|nr:DUF4376 domain-containing protein [Thalassobaculum litoreum]SDF83893.1 protein of unknown function [Thalassobaculum litoreum DSM 18839]
MADFYAHVVEGEILRINIRAGTTFQGWTPGPNATDADYRAHDLWPITGTRPAGTQWQRVTGPVYVADTETETVERQYTVTDFTLAERKEVMRAAINEERDRRIYLPIDAVDIKGDGSVMVEPDIRNTRDEANLIALSLRATQLAAAEITDPVMPFGAADNIEYMLTPTEMIAVAAAPFTRASGLFVRARALKDAVEDAADGADLDLIDIAAGSIDSSGSWPS